MGRDDMPRYPLLGTTAHAAATATTLANTQQAREYSRPLIRFGTRRLCSSIYNSNSPINQPRAARRAASFFWSHAAPRYANTGPEKYVKLATKSLLVALHLGRIIMEVLALSCLVDDAGPDGPVTKMLPVVALLGVA